MPGVDQVVSRPDGELFIGHKTNRDRQGIGDRAKSEENREGETVVLVDRSTDGRECNIHRPVRWGTEAQGTH